MARDVMRVVSAPRNVSAFAAAVAIGVLHRAAATTPWANDRLISADPAWIQLMAPFWHSTVPESPSIANALTNLVDPLSAASSAGDSRAVAAVFVMLAAFLLVVTLRRAAVVDAVALPLAFAVTTPVLAAAPAAVVTDSIQLALAVTLLLAWHALVDRTRERRLVVATLTVVGVLNHAGFAAFAAGIWLAEVMAASNGQRVRAIATAIPSLVLALLVSASILGAADAQARIGEVPRPSTSELAIGLVTGRFVADLQPAAVTSWRSAIAEAVPTPLVLAGPLIALAVVLRRPTRMVLGAALGAACMLLFSATTWVPDDAAAAAAARIASIVLIGVGLTWIWRSGVSGSKPLACAAAVVVGVGSWSTPRIGLAHIATADLDAFRASAATVAARGVWSADRLSTTRALLQSLSPQVRDRWTALSGADPVRVAVETPVIVFTGRTGGAVTPDVWDVPAQLPYPGADAYLNALPPAYWLAVALRGPAAGGFCGDLIARLGVRDEQPRDLAVVTNPHLRRATVTGHGSLDVPFMEADSDERARVPAHFSVQTQPMVRISINGRGSTAADGMMLATFDPDEVFARSWVVGDCAHPRLPPIDDRRLRAAFLLEANGAATVPPLPVVFDTSIDIPLAGNDDWFPIGWHASEGPGAPRWTAAIDAAVTVLVSHRQPLTLRMTGSLAQRPTTSNTLQVLWNGSRVAMDLRGAIDGRWDIPATQVKRGVNTLTLRVGELVAPGEGGASADRRQLGLAVTRLSIGPAIESATAAGSPSLPR